MGEGDEDNKLKRAINSALTLATEKNLKSISLPACGFRLIIPAGSYPAICADTLNSNRLPHEQIIQCKFRQ